MQRSDVSRAVPSAVPTTSWRSNQRVGSEGPSSGGGRTASLSRGAWGVGEGSRGGWGGVDGRGVGGMAGKGGDRGGVLGRGGEGGGGGMGGGTRGGRGGAVGGDVGKKLKVVEVDALVLTKVLRHCRDNYPTPVNGQLLGMDTGDRLEVTNSFPLPQKKDVYAAVQKDKLTDTGPSSGQAGQGIDERVEEEFESYQDRMAELMHDVSVDCFTIGWYQTLSFGDLKNKDNIDSLVLYQELVDKAIMLGFDPLLNAMGRMAFKAYRASDEFLAIYHSAEEDCSKYNRLKGKDILVQVPIVIKNSLLVDAYLQDWTVGDPAQSRAEFNALEVDQNNYLEKNLNFLFDCLDELGVEQDKLIRYQRERVKQLQLQKQINERRRLENEQRRLRGETLLPMEFEGPAFRKIDPPSQISALLMSSQAGIQCAEINSISAENLAKLYLLSRGNCMTTD
eukprot:GHVQ01009791.1.p1 GENE.GHVQ01009791.1~~GHVQ01009791.1.p1  ORF type:complete len:449 (+),score=88.84 GHVQ01009791.1:405-1751(+)